jgi:hypothetical protein
MPGFRRTYWSLGIPLREASWKFETLLGAVAGLEEVDRFIKVEDLVCRPGPEDSEGSTAVLSLSALLPE